MLTVSNDETAELLTRELGVARGGTGTTAAGHPRDPGRARARSASRRGRRRCTTARASRPTTGSRARRCSASSRSAAQPRFAAILDGLPVAGRTGTLVGPVRRDRARRAGCGPRPATSTASSASPASSTPARRHRSPSRPLRVPRQRRLFDGDRREPARSDRARRSARTSTRPPRPTSCRRRADRLAEHVDLVDWLHRAGAPRRDSCARPDWRRVADNPQQTVRELKDLVIAYAKQEATDPLKGLGALRRLRARRRAAASAPACASSRSACSARCRSNRGWLRARQLVVGAVRGRRRRCSSSSPRSFGSPGRGSRARPRGARDHERQAGGGARPQDHARRHRVEAAGAAGRGRRSAPRRRRCRRSRSRSASWSSTIAAAYLLGRRKGKRRQTVLEIRRI